jgi:hypothetical protein
VGPNHPQFNSNLDGFYPVWVWIGRGMKVTMHPHLRPRFGTSWAVLTFPPSFMLCVGKPLYYQNVKIPRCKNTRPWRQIATGTLDRSWNSTPFI